MTNREQVFVPLPPELREFVRLVAARSLKPFNEGTGSPKP
jgi:hypothetical protein